ncbi:MAG: membrane protein insertion efficiency factor YidD [Verrucomicrobia bacterium]|nr:membrane protein insertion efficiency factor YidD [Verrucomicrobiota bacterium]
MREAAVLPIRIYTRCLSPLKTVILGQSACCRYWPSCSRFAAEAIRIHGIGLGSWLALKRIGRCHPWGGAGYDPVPSDPQPVAPAATVHRRL